MQASHATTEGRYASVMRRLTPVDSAAAVVIQVLTMVALWHDGTKAAVSLASFFAVMPLNIVATLFVVPRWGAARTDMVRNAVNIVIGVSVNHFTGWPLPVWMWLPYAGLTYMASPAGSWALLLSMCASYGLVAMHDGVPWMIPLACVTFALIARVVSNGRVAVVREIAERAEAQRAQLDMALEQLKHEAAAREGVERELAQAHKLESVGRLASGIAHEMNTPLQFVSDSVVFLEEGMGELLATASGDRESLDYMRSNMPEAIRLVKDGLARVTAIVTSLRDLAHPGTTRAPLDVNRAVDAALILTKHEYKYVADVALALGDVPEVQANPGEINQVLVNLLVNAAHAIAERHARDRRRGRITVSTERDGASVVVRVTDDGAGVDDGARDKIFEPFFTTKPIGRGTGQGLAIARAIVERHRGSIAFTSERDVGTTFVVRLPCAESATERAA